MRHQSPFLAQAWTELVVRELNNFYRKKDKLEAETSVAFLSSQIAKANYAEIKQVIAELIQQKTQKLTLIEASNFYVFEYLDPPAVMEKKSEPSRSLIFFVGAFLGGCLGILIILIRYYALNKKFI
jgi:LPS O-antigen subunit length determinant protein (WzzB/FepE family)